MKKILSFILVLLFNNIYSQSFPGVKPEVLLGKQVTPISISEQLQYYGYRNFVSVFDTINREINIRDLKNKPFYNSKTFSSEYSKLKPLVFTVNKIYELNEKNSFKSYKEYVFQLSNDEIGILYYRYDPTFESSFELELINDEILPNELFCNNITSKKDKFENSEMFMSPIGMQGISLIKTVENNITSYYIRISVDGNTLNVREKGAFILFDNGMKISKPNQIIEVDVNSGQYSSGWEYSAFIKLNKSDIEILSKHLITDIKLFIYDNEISKNNAIKIREYLKCLTK